MPNGVIPIFKEKGYTSFDVVAKLKSILHFKKIGHTGTLDPDATGVLLVCLGRATKLVEHFTSLSKTYEAVMKLGITTDTQDISGNVLFNNEDDVFKISDEELKQAVVSFDGGYMQTPPMYSALKYKGKKLYELARAGIEVERQPRLVQLSNIDISEINMPFVKFSVTCSKGTYIRTLISDIGEILKCGACMSELVRVKAAGFELDSCYKLNEIQDMVNNGDNSFIIDMNEIFKDLPALRLNHIGEKMVINGNTINKAVLNQICVNADEIQDNQRIRMISPKEQLIAIYEYRKEKQAYANLYTC